MTINVGRIQYQSRATATDLKTYIESLGTNNRTIRLKGDLTATETFEVPANISIDVSKKASLVISDGKTITFNGSVRSGKDSWITCSPDNPPVFNNKEYISPDEFTGTDSVKWQCAINSASRSRCRLVVPIYGKQYVLSSSLYLMHDPILNPGFVTDTDVSIANSLQGRITIDGGTHNSLWLNFKNDTHSSTMIKFTQISDNCLISDLSSHPTLGTTASRNVLIRGIDIVGNTSGAVVYLRNVVENTRLENCTIRNTHISGDGALINTIWGASFENVFIYGNPDRVADAALNTGTGLHFYQQDFAAGIFLMKNVWCDGWSTGFSLGRNRYLGDPSGQFLTMLETKGCVAQNCDTGLYIGNGIRVANLNNYYEKCLTRSIFVDYGAMHVKINGGYINTHADAEDCIKIGNDFNEDGLSEVLDTVYNVTLDNVHFLNIPNITAIVRNPSVSLELAQYTELNCSFSFPASTTAGRARDFRLAEGINGYQGASFITGARYIENGTRLDDLGTTYVPVHINHDNIKFGRSIGTAIRSLNLASDGTLDYENKGNVFKVVADGYDLKSIEPWEEGREIIIECASLDMTVKNLNGTYPIFMSSLEDRIMKYRETLHLVATEESGVKRWCEPGKRRGIHIDNTDTQATSGTVDISDKDVGVIKITTNDNITDISPHIDGAHIYLQAAHTSGFTLKNLSGSGTTTIHTNTGSDKAVAFKSVVHLLGTGGRWEEIV